MNKTQKSPEFLDYQSGDSKRQISRFLGVGLVVWTLIGILLMSAIVAILVPTTYVNPGHTPREATITDLKCLSVAVETYRLDTGEFPSTSEGLMALTTCPPGVTGWSGPYVEEVTTDHWGRPYRYQFPGALDPKKFDLTSVGEDGLEGSADDLTPGSRP